MKILFAFLLCASAQAATMPDLELLRAVAADQGVAVDHMPPAPKPQAARAETTYESLGTIRKGSGWFHRPKTALKDRSFRLDESKDDIWLNNDANSAAIPVGSRVWLKGAIDDKVLTIHESVVFPAKNAKDLPAKAENAAFAAEIGDVSPWSDHIPFARPGDGGQYLVIETKLKNKTDSPLDITLSHAFLSFDAASEGGNVAGLSMRARSGLSSGQTTLTIAPGATVKLQWRGDNLYPTSSQGQTLYATLQLSAGEDSLIIRGSGAVIQAH